MGQPPTGVKRHAEAIDRLAQQQRLKAELGRDGINGIHQAEQGMGVAVIGHHFHISQLQPGQHTGLLAKAGVGMGAQKQASIRVIAACRLHHGHKIGLAGERPRNREIPGHLIDQQHPGSGILQQTPRQGLRFTGTRGITVVFGDPEVYQLTKKPFGPRQHGLVAGSGDQLLKLAGLAGIVIDTDRIGDK